MAERPSSWTRAVAPGVVRASAILAALAAAAPTSAQAGQDDLDAACAAAADPSACRLGAAAVRLIQPRVGLALWGGSPVPGTASTVGQRVAASPRVDLGFRLVGVPAELPPITDRAVEDGAGAMLTGASVQATVGLLHGLAPLPTVGGFLSLDLIARASYLRTPTGKGFDRPALWGYAAGVRVGALRESFTLPGLSLTATYGRSSRWAFGDPAGTATDGAIEGAVAGLNATAAVSKRFYRLRLIAGAAYDRYRSSATVRYAGFAGGPQSTVEAVALTERWSGFGGVSWSRLIYRLALEGGWQESPTPVGLPAGVSLDPPGWWAGAAVRIQP